MPPLSSIQFQLAQYKEWLIELRKDSRMTLGKIKIELYNQKGITASLHQLETYFKNLGQRKNLSRPEWRLVFRALASQKAVGRTCEVYMSGKLISGDSLQKKRKNAKPEAAIATCLADAEQFVRQLPDGVKIKSHHSLSLSTPGPQQGVDALPMSHTRPGSNPGAEPSIRQDSFSVDNDLVLGLHATSSYQSTSRSSIVPHHSNTSTTDAIQLMSCPVNTDTNFGAASQWDMDFMTATSVLSFNHGIMRPGSPELFQYSFNDPYVLDDWNQEIAHLNFHSHSHIPDRRNWERLYRDMPMSLRCDRYSVSSVESARILRKFISVVSVRRGSRLGEPIPTAEEIIDILQSQVSIEDMAEAICEPLAVVGTNSPLTDPFAQLILFSVVNNFSGIQKIPMESIMRFIDHHESSRSTILRLLRSGTSTIFSTALAENLFKAAVEAGDVKTAHDLLALKLFAPDDIPLGTHPFRRSALEKASEMRHFEMMRLLLHHGADVNKTHMDRKNPMLPRGALECAVKLWGEYDILDPKILDLLLDNGATVRAELAEAAIRWGDKSLIEKLIFKLPPSEHVQCFSSDMLLDATEYLRNDLSLAIIRQIIQTCQETHESTCIISNQDLLVGVMIYAAKRKNSALIRLLSPHAGQEGLDQALTAAARSGSHKLIHMLLESGANCDGPACVIDGDGHSPLTTPLAEAIRNDDTALVRLFTEKGAWNQIGEPGRLQAILEVVAESDDDFYLDKILQMVPDPNPKALTRPLSIAIRKRHEGMAMKLLGAGADVNASPRSTYPNDRTWTLMRRLFSQPRRVASPPPHFQLLYPLQEALSIKSPSIVWAILDCDAKPSHMRVLGDLSIDPMSTLEQATEWGDQQIIKALSLMGASVDNQLDGSLSIAIKNGEKSLVDLLISLGADPNGHSQRHGSPLAAAAQVGDIETATYLLEHGADPADQQAILNAFTHAQDVLELVLQRLRKRYPKGRSGFGGEVLRDALDGHNDAILALCLNARFDVNHFVTTPGQQKWSFEMLTPLGFAIRKYRGGRLDLISRLLDAGGDANFPAFQDEWRQVSETAFLQVIEIKSLPLVELLISKGADVHKEAKLGLKRTPLQKACEVQSCSIVDLLLTHNVDLAAKVGSTRIAKRLLDSGADVDAPGAQVQGLSAIQYAAKYGRLHMIQVLFNASGASFTAEKCQSAITLAQDNGHLACAALLMDLSSRSQGFIES
ncbi:hypothetical protein PFICI_00289 [Pestalotiopsis fici W106-1]|uniref:Clr5 domain-containing protein n=1 Tax=Pestalotiopsis fici (strain W106-1 / CGMCC3.15140) TaxID=1229662 RepID=W3XMF6_PESFW|nr:uncharacterized protein PFICI_00289 [Pestalotiopsis fici W106-1]ETS86461.1 hypothetical protein PFICI_00289 [Pestalotiopsis fici W106-1]